MSPIAWKIILKRILAKDNLLMWGVTPTDSLLCVGGCSQPREEMINHLFMECGFFSSTLNLVLHLLVVYTVLRADISSHALQFGGAYAIKKDIQFRFQVIWLTCIWVIWKERNSRIFSNKQNSQNRLLECIKLHCWWWLNTYKLYFYFYFHSWWLNMSICIGYATL